MALGSIAVAIILPFLPVGRWFGFLPPPPLFFVYLVAATAAYLALVEITKSLFYRFTAAR
jgi:P-type Mg2+ transporter